MLSYVQFTGSRDAIMNRMSVLFSTWLHRNRQGNQDHRNDASEEEMQADSVQRESTEGLDSTRQQASSELESRQTLTVEGTVKPLCVQIT